MAVDWLCAIHNLHADDRAVLLFLEASHAFLEGVIVTEINVSIRTMRSKSVELPAAHKTDLHGKQAFDTCAALRTSAWQWHTSFTPNAVAHLAMVPILCRFETLWTITKEEGLPSSGAWR